MIYWIYIPLLPRGLRVDNSIYNIYNDLKIYKYNLKLKTTIKLIWWLLINPSLLFSWYWFSQISFHHSPLLLFTTTLWVKLGWKCVADPRSPRKLSLQTRYLNLDFPGHSPAFYLLHHNTDKHDSSDNKARRVKTGQPFQDDCGSPWSKLKSIGKSWLWWDKALPHCAICSESLGSLFGADVTQKIMLYVWKLATNPRMMEFTVPKMKGTGTRWTSLSSR